LPVVWLLGGRRQNLEGVIQNINRLIRFFEVHDIHRRMVVRAYTHDCLNARVFVAHAYDYLRGPIIGVVVSPLPDEIALMIERMRRNGYHIFQTKEYLEGA